MQRIERDALRGHLENLILAVLERSDAHGLEVLRRLEDRDAEATADAAEPPLTAHPVATPASTPEAGS